MCYYNGQKVSKEAFIQLKHLEKQLKAYQQAQAVINGFQYGDTLLLKAAPDKKSFDVVTAHWEFIPPWIRNEGELQKWRAGLHPRTGVRTRPIPLLNAQGEQLLTTGQGKPSLFREAALQRRCLIPSTGFYEWKVVNKVRYPHCITVTNGKGHFFMAGVWQPWTDEATGRTIDTYAMVTTSANSLMASIHNTKKRMPTILPDALAYEWLLGRLTEDRISELATYRYPAADMQATPVHRDFLTREAPTEACYYHELTDLFS